MNEKPVAMFVAVMVAVPACMLCILGPAVVSGFVAGWFGWVAEMRPGGIALLALSAAAVFAGWRYRLSQTKLARKNEDFASLERMDPAARPRSHVGNTHAAE